MEEEKGFSSIQLVVAENNPIWGFLLTYGLLKLPKIFDPKLHGSGPSKKVL
jgi:hypothetical protein